MSTASTPCSSSPSELVGHVAVPGDKSISHRAVLIGAICDGETRITGFGRSADTEATIAAVRALGSTVYEHGDDTLRVFGKGLRGLRAPGRPIDCANAGTLVRLIAGILAGQAGRAVRADRRRLALAPPDEPDRRAARPHGRAARDDRRPPAADGSPGRPLRAIDYELPVASAQVKSAILLAGLYAEGETTVVEPAPTRDHTERMLEAAGASVTVRPTSVTVRRAERLSLGEVEVPGDFSSAAPFVVAATLVPGSELHIHGVNLNPRRTGLLDDPRADGGEHHGLQPPRDRRRARRRSRGPLRAARRHDGGAEEVPLAIDELPLFALAAACARGESVLRGAEELRAKETDRIEATVDALRALGARARATRGRLRGHRRADAAARRPDREPRRPPDRDARRRRRARLARRRPDRGRRGVAVSFPGFFELVDAATPDGEDTEPVGRVIVAIDGPAGAGKSSVARALAARLGLPLPRHGCDVPRADVARAPRRDVALDDGPALESARREPTPVDVRSTAGSVSIAAEDVTPGHPRARDRRGGPGRRATSRGARGDARAAARARADRATR